MTEEQFRQAIADEALSWTGTPYRNTGRIKGVGCNCAQFLFGVAIGSGALPADSPEPRWYTAQLATHSKEERLRDYLLAYGAVEIDESRVKQGDFILYRSGQQSHGHAAIVLEWPEKIIHVLSPNGCHMGHAYEGRLAGHILFFTLWKGQPQ